MKPTTLTLKKPAAQPQPAQKQRVERTLVGKEVVLQTRSPTRITGTIVSFDGGWIVINGTEHRWNADGSLSAPITTGTFKLERSVVTYFAEVA